MSEADLDCRRRDACALVAEVFARLQAMEIERLLDLFADDMVLEMPVRGAGGPERLEGKEAVGAFLRRFPQIFRRLDFVAHTEYPMADPSLVAAEYRSEGEAHTGLPYRNVYAAIFRVRDGKIVLWREYFNPIVINNALHPGWTPQPL
jgi:ketosteroid isomerase-like protein